MAAMLGHIAEFFFPTEKNLGSGTWASRKARAITAGMGLAMLLALVLVFGSGPGVPGWLYLLCLGYGGWAVNAGYAWVHSFERAREQARAEKLRAWDPPHEDPPEDGKSDPS